MKLLRKGEILQGAQTIPSCVLHGGMGVIVARASAIQRIQQFGSHTAIYSRHPLGPGLQAVPVLTRSYSNIHRRFVSARLNSANSWKSFNICRAMDSSVSTNGSIVTRAGMKPGLGSPRPNPNLVSLKGLASGVSRDSKSAASTSDSSAHQAEEESWPNEKEKKSSQRLGVFAFGAGIFSSILSYIIKLCGGGYTPYVKQAEKDIDKVADFVEAGARLVVKVADDIEEMAHVAALSAQEAEDLALKVEAKTKMVKETLDAIADVLEGDRKLSTVLTDYANMKKEETPETTKRIWKFQHLDILHYLGGDLCPQTPCQLFSILFCACICAQKILLSSSH